MSCSFLRRHTGSAHAMHVLACIGKERVRGSYLSFLSKLIVARKLDLLALLSGIFFDHMTKSISCCLMQPELDDLCHWSGGWGQR